MKIKFWGTRGSIPVPGKDTLTYGGNTCCLEILLGTGKRVIIDAGTGIRPLGDHLVSQGENVDIHLLMTHVHWDHVQGFPFFDPVFNPLTRILVDGSPSSMKGLRAIFNNKLGDGFFPVKFEELSALIEHSDRLRRGTLNIDNTIIDTIPLHHPQGGFGFRFREGNKTLVFITDNELTEKGWKGSRPEDFVRFCKDADILIHDSQFIPEEINNRRGWGHSDYSDAVALALKAHVGQLFLFHHDPSRKDPEIALIEARCREIAATAEADLVIHAAREGSELLL